MYKHHTPYSLNISYLNHRGKGVKKPQKLGVTQAVLQTLNEKFQNTKIGTTIYIVLNSLRDEQCEQIMS